MNPPVRQRRRRGIVALFAVVSLAAGLGTASASGPSRTAAALTGAAPVISCAQVAQFDLGALPGASTEISAATPVAAADNPEGDWDACEVTGVIAPQLQFQLLLPTSTYQEEYLQDGCGGYCGSVAITTQAASGCAPLTNGAFAIASDNEGHYGAAVFSAAFGADPTLRASFGYQSEHLLAVAAKAIIARYYGSAPRDSYFDGCSQGGHEGLTEAQRYPRDFNGIIVGSPASVMTELNVFYQAWNAQANTAADGSPIITLADLTPLHNAVLKACDADSTGVIIDPLACHFDPASIACAGRTTTAADFCLTPAQVIAARKLYEGPRDAQGKLLYPGWQVPGSEPNWAAWIVPTAAGTPSIDQGIAQDTLRYRSIPASTARPRSRTSSSRRPSSSSSPVPMTACTTRRTRT